MSLSKGSLNISEVYKGSLPIASIYQGNNLIWEKNKGIFGFRIAESTPNSVEYSEDSVGKIPISYDTTNQVFDLGSWESFINEHFTPVMLKYDGTEDYELNRNNQEYKLDGVTPSDISNGNYNGNAMVRIKKFYISITAEKLNGSPYDGGGTKYIHVKISDNKIDNSFTCYGFIDSAGNEHDYAYYSMYEGSLLNNKLRSIKGATPYLSKMESASNLTAVQNYAKANGNGWNIDNYSLFNAIRLLFVLIAKDVSLYPVYGYSRIDVNTTGITSANGAFTYGGSSNSSRINPYKLCWIEEFAGQRWKIINGVCASSFYTSNSVGYYKVSHKLTEPYDNLSNYTEEVDCNLKTFTNFGYSQNQDISHNLLLPKGNDASNYSPANDSNYGGSQTGAYGISIASNLPFPCVVGGSAGSSEAIGMFSLVILKYSQAILGSRLTYLAQPSNG